MDDEVAAAIAGLRQTGPTRAVAAAMAYKGWMYGAQISTVTGLSSSSISAILRRLQAAGLAVGRWEDPAYHEGSGRQRRHYYRLTPVGVRWGQAVRHGRV